MNYLLIVSILYLLICTVIAISIPSARYAWKELYESLIRDTYDAFVSWYVYKKIRYFLGLIIIAVLKILAFILLFIVTPWIIFWLNRIYKNSFEQAPRNISPIIKPIPIKKEYIINPLIIQMDKNLTFTPERNQVIYVESYVNDGLNKYIIENYKRICELFQTWRLDFIYFPKVIENINNDTVNYLFPFLNKDDIIFNKTDTQTIIDSLLSHSSENTPFSGGLLK